MCQAHTCDVVQQFARSQLQKTFWFFALLTATADSARSAPPLAAPAYGGSPRAHATRWPAGCTTVRLLASRLLPPLRCPTAGCCAACSQCLRTAVACLVMLLLQPAGPAASSRPDGPPPTACGLLAQAAHACVLALRATHCGSFSKQLLRSCCRQPTKRTVCAVAVATRPSRSRDRLCRRPTGQHRRQLLLPSTGPQSPAWTRLQQVCDLLHARC